MPNFWKIERLPKGTGFTFRVYGQIRKNFGKQSLWKFEEVKYAILS
jgi:hypothetical protein